MLDCTEIPNCDCSCGCGGSFRFVNSGAAPSYKMCVDLSQFVMPEVGYQWFDGSVTQEIDYIEYDTSSAICLSTCGDTYTTSLSVSYIGWIAYHQVGFPGTITYRQLILKGRSTEATSYDLGLSTRPDIPLDFMYDMSFGVTGTALNELGTTVLDFTGDSRGEVYMRHSCCSSEDLTLNTCSPTEPILGTTDLYNNYSVDCRILRTAIVDLSDLTIADPTCAANGVTQFADYVLDPSYKVSIPQFAGIGYSNITVNPAGTYNRHTYAGAGCTGAILSTQSSDIRFDIGIERGSSFGSVKFNSFTIRGNFSSAPVPNTEIFYTDSPYTFDDWNNGTPAVFYEDSPVIYGGQITVTPCPTNPDF